MLPYINARAHAVPLTSVEIEAATDTLVTGPVCVSRVQRQLGIGWNRAADLVAHIAGFDALPAVAKKLFPEAGGGAQPSSC